MHEILKILSSKIQQINVRFVSYASYLMLIRIKIKTQPFKNS